MCVFTKKAVVLILKIMKIMITFYRIKELEDIRKQMENNYKKEQEAYNRK